MKQKRIYVLALATVFSLLLSGCSTKENNSDFNQQTTEEYIHLENSTTMSSSQEFSETSSTTSVNEGTTQESTAPTHSTHSETETEKISAPTDNSSDSTQSVGSIFDYLTQSVKPNYNEKVKTDKPLEKKYIDKGSYAISYIEYASEEANIGKYEIWYPTELSTSNRVYPLVVMANGTGVKASSYKAIFEHLASWGFVVIGNEDENSWNGVSSSKSLDFMLKCNRNKNNLFYQKIDTKNIGVAGHSQGGVGAINAVTAQSNGSQYKAMYTASTTHLALAQALSWSYDVSKIKIPYFMTAGTLQFDSGNGNDVGIAPLWSLQENYQAISRNIPKVLARRVDTDHGNMLANADGYMTAWFMYYLQGDTTAGKVFFGTNAEILSNANWQDVEKNV